MNELEKIVNNPVFLLKLVLTTFSLSILGYGGIIAAIEDLKRDIRQTRETKQFWADREAQLKARDMGIVTDLHEMKIAKSAKPVDPSSDNFQLTLLN